MHAPKNVARPTKLFLLVSLAAVLAFNLVPIADAQSASNIPRIGFLSYAAAGTETFDAFREGLQELGYVDGKNVIVEQRYANFNDERVDAFAAELVKLKVDVIVTTAPAVTRRAQRATKTIPIVMGAGTDPVAAGLVTSLARPGGNVTGVATLSSKLHSKRLELLKEISPDSSEIAVLVGPASAEDQLLMKELEAAADALQLHLLPVIAQQTKDYERAFAEIRERGASALLVGASLVGYGFPKNRARIVELAAKSRLPTMYVGSEFPEAGGLVSYGAGFRSGFRRAAYYVDRILKGAKPADLPVEMPMTFELVINLRAAKELGLTIPASVLAQADRVIQ